MRVVRARGVWLNFEVLKERVDSPSDQRASGPQVVDAYWTARAPELLALGWQKDAAFGSEDTVEVAAG